MILKDFILKYKNVFILLAVVLTAFLAFYIVSKQKSKAFESQIKNNNPISSEAQKVEAETQNSVVQKTLPKKDFSGTPVLMYHHVGDLPENADSTRRDLTVSTEDFTKQINWLREQGYNSVTLDQLYLSTQKQFILPKKAIAISFDDGYEDVFLNAVPVLKQNGFVGSFAVITSFVGTTGYANWVQVESAQKDGMEIVSHTKDHFDGSNTVKYNSEFIFNNLVASKQDLLDHGINTNILIYPYGHFTENYIEQAKTAGYKMAFTVEYGRVNASHDLMKEPRVRVHGGGSLDKFIDILLGRISKTPKIESPKN